MKNIYKIVFICFVSLNSLAQVPTLKRANKYFANKAYLDAAQMYLALKPTQEILQNLGDCYYFNGQSDQAVKYYEQINPLTKNNVKEDVIIRYANALKGINNIKKADEIMTAFFGKSYNTLNYISELQYTVPFDYEIKSVAKDNVNSGNFGLVFWGNKVVYASYQANSKKTYNWNQKPYLDLYEATLSKEGLLENVKPFSNVINTKTHESNATFTQDGKTMYFSRTNSKRVKVDGEKIATVKIFKAEYVNNEWINVSEVPFSSDTYSVEHPCLSADGKKLYFASDMPGTIGSMDIYYVDVNADGTYGKPQNLGNTVNSISREQFPFISEEGTLYFSSDRYEGLGGLDIFMSKNRNNTFETPINLGSTINSAKDDFAFVLKNKSQEGNFSSNRGEKDDIYSFTRKENEKQYFVEGFIKDKKTKEILPGSKVSLYDENNKLVSSIVVGSDGKYFLNTKPNHKYKVEATKDLYIPSSVDISTDSEGQARFSIEMEIQSFKDKEEVVVEKEDGHVYVELENIYFDFNKWNIKDKASKTLDVLVDLMKKYPTMEVQIGAHTDSKASEEYNMTLSENRAKATVDYIVSKGIESTRLTYKGFGETMPLVNCGDKCTEAEYAKNRRCEFKIIK
ncbi:OmpA family protein [Flavobacterium aciduliphilum]|nr:OmpA family protein [Flavobacterium aciduliphilum]